MGNTDVLFQTQQAVYGVLIADGTLSGLVTGIFDRAPENQTFPYIVLGHWQAKPQDTFERNGHIGTLTLSVFSLKRDMDEVLAIATRVDDLLDWQQLPATADFVPVYTFYMTGRAQRLSDGRTRQVTLTYSIYREQN